MTDFFLQTGLSNAVIAFGIALIAFAVGAKSKRPHLAHVLWILVLVKLLTPPLFCLPVAWPSFASEPEFVSPAFLETEANVLLPELPIVAMNETIQSNSEPSSSISLLELVKPGLLILWLAGTVFIVVWSLFRVWRFHCLLARSWQSPDPKVQQVGRQIAVQLGLKRAPLIQLTTANLSPLVWWIGGRIHVVLPKTVVADLEQDQWRWVVAHELAHVRRRDYLVRWLEWIAVACFWWNPVVWWTQRNLRVAEEICCDELVMRRLQPRSHAYASSILAVVESPTRRRRDLL